MKRGWAGGRIDWIRQGEMRKGVGRRGGGRVEEASRGEEMRGEEEVELEGRARRYFPIRNRLLLAGPKNFGCIEIIRESSLRAREGRHVRVSLVLLMIEGRRRLQLFHLPLLLHWSDRTAGDCHRAVEVAAGPSKTRWMTS